MKTLVSAALVTTVNKRCESKYTIKYEGHMLMVVELKKHTMSGRCEWSVDPPRTQGQVSTPPIYMGTMHFALPPIC